MLTVWQTDVQGAVDKLLVLEKQARQVCHKSRWQACKAILKQYV